MPRSFPLSALLALVTIAVGVVLPGGARALLIDDFEAGAFTVVDSDAGTGGTFQNQTGLPTTNVIGGQRRVFAGNSTGGVGLGATAALALTGGDDDAVFSQADSLFLLTYDSFGSLDITLGGTANRILIDQLPALVLARTTVTFIDSVGRKGDLAQVVGGAVAQFRYSLFTFEAFFNEAAVTGIEIAVELPQSFGSQTWGISGIQIVPEPASGALLCAGLFALAAARRGARLR